jgi:hypothetical protein
MDVVALVLYAVFVVVGFGWRTWVQWRRTGDTGLRLHALRLHHRPVPAASVTAPTGAG